MFTNIGINSFSQYQLLDCTIQLFCFHLVGEGGGGRDERLGLQLLHLLPQPAAGLQCGEQLQHSLWDPLGQDQAVQQADQAAVTLVHELQVEDVGHTTDLAPNARLTKYTKRLRLAISSSSLAQW